MYTKMHYKNLKLHHRNMTFICCPCNSGLYLSGLSLINKKMRKILIAMSRANTTNRLYKNF